MRQHHRAEKQLCKQRSAGEFAAVCLDLCGHSVRRHHDVRMDIVLFRIHEPIEQNASDLAEIINGIFHLIFLRLLRQRTD